jgi:hypothetical protein
MHGAECRNAAEKGAPTDADIDGHKSSLAAILIARILDGAPQLSKGNGSGLQLAGLPWRVS